MYQNPHAGYQQPMQSQMIDPRAQQQPRFVLTNTPNGQMYLDQATNQYYYPQQLQQLMAQVQQQPMQPMNQRFGNFNAGQGQYPQPMSPTMNQMPNQPGPRLTGSQIFDPNQVPTTQDNRYGDPGREVTLVQQPQTEKADMRIPINPSSVKKPETVKKALPKKKLLSTPVNLNKFGVRQHPFTELEIIQVDLNVVGNGFASALSELYDQSVSKDIASNKTTIVGNCRLQDPYYETSMEGMEESVFISDIEAVYRQMRDIISGAVSRADIVFFTEYNQWLTDHINDWLRVLDARNTTIDSFYDDFNDLKKHLGDRKTDNPEMGTIYAELCANMRKVLVTCLDKNNSKCDEGDNSPCICLTDKTHIVYTKLLSIELWKDGIPDEGRTGNRLVSSLLSHVDSPIFYICTIDKVIYKVICTVKYEVLVTRIEG